MKISPLDRIFLLITGILAAYQVVFGLEGLDTLPLIAYSISFGVLLVAGLLLIILGFDVLSSPAVVIISTLIPLSLAAGLVAEYLESFRTVFMIFAILGFLTVAITRLIPIEGKLPTILLAMIHGIAGMIIFLLPIILVWTDLVKPWFVLVGVGGGLIGVGGLLLAFLKSGKPILSQELILTVLPGLLFLMTSCFVAGFLYG